MKTIRQEIEKLTDIYFGEDKPISLCITEYEKAGQVDNKTILAILKRLLDWAEAMEKEVNKFDASAEFEQLSERMEKILLKMNEQEQIKITPLVGDNSGVVPLTVSTVNKT